MIKTPPVVFPLVGLFHIVWAVVAIVNLMSTGFHSGASYELVQVGWMLGATISWLAACDMHRWGALAYILLTIADVVVYLLEHNGKIGLAHHSNLIFIDGVFSFFLLFFYKRFR